MFAVRALRAMWFSLLVLGCVAAGAASPAHAQSLWSPAVDLYLPPQPPGAVIGTAGQPDIDADGLGNAVVVWSDWLNGVNSTVRAARFISTSQTWTATVPLSTPGRVATEARVATGTNGDAVAVWQEADAARALIYAARLASGAGTWTAPVPLSTAGSDDVLADVAVDQAGNAVAVWSRRSEGFRLYRARYSAAGGTWGPAVPLSASGSRALFPRIEFDGSSNAVAVWVSELDNDRAVIKAARYVGGSDMWLPALDISESDRYGNAPDVAVSASGNAAVVWTYGPRIGQGSVIQASRFNPATQSWTGIETLSELAVQTASPHVAIDPAGRVTAVWQVDTGAARLVQGSRYSPMAASWSEPHNLSAPVRTEAGAPRVAMDAAGSAIATWWEQGPAANLRVRAAFFNVAAGAWSQGADVSPASDLRSDAPAVALTTTGRAALVWRTASTATDHAKAAHALVPSGPLLAEAAVNFPEVTLAWTPPLSGPPASAYTVVASAYPDGVPIARLPVENQLSVLVTAPAGTYYVRVFATMGGDVVPSNQVRVDVSAGGPLPTAPLSLRGTVSASVVTLMWSPPANAAVAPVQTYVIEAGSRPGASDLANFATGSATPGYAAVVPDGNYYVRVRASRASGLGPPTPDIRIVVGPPPPGAPGLSGGATGAGSVSLTWTAAPTPGAAVTGYQLQAGSAPGLSDVATIALPSWHASYAATGIPPGRYYVRLVALSTQGPGNPSNEVVVTIP